MKRSWRNLRILFPGTKSALCATADYESIALTAELRALPDRKILHRKDLACTWDLALFHDEFIRWQMFRRLQLENRKR